MPTIVFGYFALTFFTPELLRGALGISVGQFNALSAGIILGMGMPTTPAYIIMTALLVATGTSLSVSAFLLVMGVVTLASVLGLRETHKA